MMDNRQFTIRQLSAPDVALVGDMLTMFGEAFRDSSTYGSARPDTNYLAQLPRRDYFIALAALKDGAVVGGLVAYVLDKAFGGGADTWLRLQAAYDLAQTMKLVKDIKVARITRAA
jgi:hypothetical protein